MNSLNPYTQMQKRLYDRDASRWSLTEKYWVIGGYETHNEWPDYKLLFRGLTDLSKKKVLDFGCGPGRNLVKYSGVFGRIDGVDISEVNLEKARILIADNLLDTNNFTLYPCNGVDIANVPTASYDILMSTITFQHICVHEIRLNYLKDFYRVIVPGGTLTMQMGFGRSSYGVDYYANNYSALTTNGGCDTRIDNVEQIKLDLERVGFTNFRHVIRPVGPGDSHPNWIFFQADVPVIHEEQD
jgi:SAM-dependent methyltransferase